MAGEKLQRASSVDPSLSFSGPSPLSAYHLLREPADASSIHAATFFFAGRGIPNAHFAAPTASIRCSGLGSAGMSQRCRPVRKVPELIGSSRACSANSFAPAEQTVSFGPFGVQDGAPECLSSRPHVYISSRVPPPLAPLLPSSSAPVVAASDELLTSILRERLSSRAPPELQQQHHHRQHAVQAPLRPLGCCRCTSRR